MRKKKAQPVDVEAAILAGIAAGQAAKDDAAAAPLSGVQRRFSRKERASGKPSALGNVYAVYPDAIQLMEPSSSAQLRGAGLMAFLFMSGLCITGTYGLLKLAGEQIIDGQFGMLDFVFTALPVGFVLFVARHWIVAAWHLDMFSADNQPTIFDRKHRKVYRLFTPLDGSADKWSQKLKPIHLQMTTHDWDDIRAEYRAELVTSGKTVSRIHRLVMIVRGRGKDADKTAEEFNIGNSMAMGPNTVPMLWEHIRRFMEERGPGVPEGEPLQNFERPKNLWQSMGVVSPFGPKFGWWWEAGKFPVVLILVAFPFTLPFFTVWAICNWISHMTMRKTIWPDEVHRRIGQATRSADACLTASR
ncbi:hypothetical protein GFK26_12000 [Variovorax paradoxus]|uniref:DUF6708 domain-containing protein n=1 Tax=Variovorax paradoxus TaxID=34073 RepID=A0A5Q0M1Y3_VARPD|nr:DUF6708 domain-containing protein [Variovorax paradoxus]QFZ83436.1 hypothetical protein GFK26_12000 [Variovorax paradoxus]